MSVINSARIAMLKKSSPKNEMANLEDESSTS
jgi:hypothetical protein